MKYKRILAALAACCGLAFTGLPVPVPVAGDLATSKAYADGSWSGRAYTRQRRGVRVRRVARRGGYYSYTNRDVINTRLWPPFLYTLSTRFSDPWAQRQTLGGPFDSGFWFDSGLWPPWNNAPYPR